MALVTVSACYEGVGNFERGPALPTDQTWEGDAVFPALYAAEPAWNQHPLLYFRGNTIERDAQGLYVPTPGTGPFSVNVDLGPVINVLHSELPAYDLQVQPDPADPANSVIVTSGHVPVASLAQLLQ